LLKENEMDFRYREYRKEPLSEDELTRLLGLLDVSASALLRKHDKFAKEHKLTGKEDDATLIPLMAAHPTMLQRPIGILGDRAVIGRPVDALLALK
jgi:arsenate reductase (glutaredoxin)